LLSGVEAKDLSVFKLINKPMKKINKIFTWIAKKYMNIVAGIIAICVAGAAVTLLFCWVMALIKHLH
jgi:hypothetical protein